MRSDRTETGARRSAGSTDRARLAKIQLLVAGVVFAIGPWLSGVSICSAAPTTGGKAEPSATRSAVALREQALDAPASTGNLELDRLYASNRPLLVRELAERGVTDPADLYKFVYQAVMGPAHAALTVADARAWLEGEWTEMKNAPLPPQAEPLLTPLRADGQLARIHLSALVAHVTLAAPPSAHVQVEALARERLAEAFARTADAWLAEQGVLRGLWERAAADSALWQKRIPVPAMTSFCAEVARAGWPAVHHSEAYRARWRPHYRVVAPSLLPPSWRTAGSAEAPGTGPDAPAGQRP